MPQNIDLHCHSTASDGTLSPAGLVQHAHRQGVDVLALTDHDITAGLAEAAQEARALGVKLVPGVEISVTWGTTTVHIVGLGIDPDNAALQQGLESLRTFRDWRAEEIGRRLDKAGIPDAYAGACRHASGPIVSRTHFAHFLVESGNARTVRDVFKHYLVHGKPGYVPGQWATLADAVGWITQAGGQAVIAHPARYRISATKLRQLVGEFKDCGGVGIEVVSGSHSRTDVENMAGMARRFGLLASSGSDYHGPEDPWIELGRTGPLPAGLQPVWSGWTL